MVGIASDATRTPASEDGGRVGLALVDAALRTRVFALAPHPHQRNWSGVPPETLGPAERDPQQRPVAILLDGAPAGFLVLHGGVGAGRFVKPYGELLIRAFFVEAALQRRGIARRALAQLPAFAQALDPAVRRLVLTVNVENETAQRCYSRAGFVDTGERYQRPGGGPQLVLELAI